MHYDAAAAIKVRELSKRTVRRPTARLYIEWSGSLTDLQLAASSDDANRVSYPEQVYDGATINNKKWFCLDDAGNYGKLDGTFHPMPDDGDDPNYQVGWRGEAVGDANGDIAAGSSVLTVEFTPRTLNTYIVAGDAALGEYPTIFNMVLRSGNNIIHTETIQQGNPHTTFETSLFLWNIQFAESYSNIDSVDIEVLQWNKPNTFVKIVEAYSNVESWVDSSEILSLSVLEETEASNRTLPVGNISCNEIDLTLQNIDNKYFPFNEASPFHAHMIPNRKIVPYIGFVDDDEEEYLAPKGAYWSGDWSVGEQDVGASTTARDRLYRLQSIEYVGLTADSGVQASGYSSPGREDAEYTYWENISAYDLLKRILTYVKQNPLYNMPDLEFDIDTQLQTTEIPIAFFSKQSYFDIIKSIAQASLSFAYMDAPTEEEIYNAAQHGNVGLRDILRVKSVGTSFADLGENTSYSARDYITRTHVANTDEVANRITVYYTQYNISNGKPTAVGDPNMVVDSNDESIERMGIIDSEYPESNLIQSYSMAHTIIGSLLNVFSEPHRAQTLQTFGDPSLRILDRAKVPEYQIFNHRDNTVSVTKSGLYAISRIQTEFDGSLRQTIECRKLVDLVGFDTIVEVGDATLIIDEAADADIMYEETGTGTGGI